MKDHGGARFEADVLAAEIAALERRREQALAEVASLRRRVADEAALAREAADEAARLDEAFGDMAARAKALEGRVDEVRREAATWGELAQQARRDALREIAAAKGLLARLATAAHALGDEDVRRWARQASARMEEP